MDEPKPVVRIFDPQSIAIATFLGSPIAGGLLWAINESRVGRGGRGVVAFFVGLAVTALMIGLGSFDVPQSVSFGLTLGATIGARTAAQSWESQLRAEDRFSDITYVSRWAAAGAGMLGCIGVLGIALLAFGLEPAAGEPCEGNVGVCTGEREALWCEDGTFQRRSCGGGCTQRDDMVECAP